VYAGGVPLRCRLGAGEMKNDEGKVGREAERVEVILITYICVVGRSAVSYQRSAKLGKRAAADWVAVWGKELS